MKIPAIPDNRGRSAVGWVTSPTRFPKSSRWHEDPDGSFADVRRTLFMASHFWELRLGARVDPAENPDRDWVEVVAVAVPGAGLHR